MAQMLIRVNEEMDIALNDLKDILDLTTKSRETSVEDAFRDFNVIVENVYKQWIEED